MVSNEQLELQELRSRVSELETELLQRKRDFYELNIEASYLRSRLAVNTSSPIVITTKYDEFYECENCGNDIFDGDNYCSKCGDRIDWANPMPRETVDGDAERDRLIDARWDA